LPQSPPPKAAPGHTASPVEDDDPPELLSLDEPPVEPSLDEPSLDEASEEPLLAVVGSTVVLDADDADADADPDAVVAVVDVVADPVEVASPSAAVESSAGHPHTTATVSKRSLTGPSCHTPIRTPARPPATRVRELAPGNQSLPEASTIHLEWSVAVSSHSASPQGWPG
jgi:hypothetical protein